jgi:membrane protein
MLAPSFQGLTPLAIDGRPRHVLVWYFATLSQLSVVYGSLTTAIVVLFSLEIAATILLLGAQVISEYERRGKGNHNAPPKPFRTQ